MGKKKTNLFVICMIILTSLSCVATSKITGLLNGNLSNNSRISNIAFCSNVTDAGECIEPGNSFPASIEAVYAYFTYKNMNDGQKWSRVWLQDGNLYDEAKDETWDGGAEGWMAYSIEDPDGLSGRFTLTITLDKEEVQKASFDIATSPSDVSSEDENSTTSFPAFGPITMAKAASENAFPIGATKSFEFGIKEVVAVFPYTNMTPDFNYIAEWLRDGNELIRKEYPWEDTSAGMHSTSLSDDNPLSAGKYTLNLYLQDELVRTANFEIIGKPTPQPVEPASKPTSAPEQRPNRPAKPEEVVDAAALKYFYMIYKADLPVLHQVANDNLTGWTRVKVVDDNPCGENAVACFRSSCDKRWGGTVFLPKAKMQNKQDFEIAENLVHELTHGMEHYGGMKCGCTVQKEFYAFAAELDYLGYSGHKDYLY